MLAVQMPDNLGEPTHRLMARSQAKGPGRRGLPMRRAAPLPPARAYYDALQPYAARLDIWHTIYNHVLADPAAIVGWVSGTGLRPFIDPLDADERTQFLAAYTGEIAAAYPAASDGKVLLRFPRLFIVAQRRG